MTFVANSVQTVFPEMQRVPVTELDQRRSTWILLHGDLPLAQFLVDYLSSALLERRADFIGQYSPLKTFRRGVLIFSVRLCSIVACEYKRQNR